MDKFTEFTVIFYFIISLLTIVSFKFSKRLNGNNKKADKALYIREMQVDKKWIIKEKNSMKNLKTGKIKCHLLKNSAPVYNVSNWVNEMKLFIGKPICKDLFLLEGNDIDEEH